MAGCAIAGRSLEELALGLQDDDADVREEAARALGESGEPRAVRYLIARLGDDNVAVAVASVRALERLGERSAVMPLYDVVQNEIADPALRHASAEALVTLGLLRRERTGPSPMFLWLAGLTGWWSPSALLRRSARGRSRCS